MPGFRSWLLHQLREAERGRETTLASIFDWNDFHAMVTKSNEQPWSELRKILNDNNWVKDESKVKLFAGPLMRLCAHYLCNEKRRGSALDSVGKYFRFIDLMLEHKNTMNL